MQGVGLGFAWALAVGGLLLGADGRRPKDLADVDARLRRDPPIFSRSQRGPPVLSPAGRLQEDPDILTVLSVNTFLMEVRVGIQFNVKPNLEERAKGFEHWFKTLLPEELPDVLVLQEIFSERANDVIRNLCSPSWSPNADPKVVLCSEDSAFQAATPVIGYPTSISPLLSGGVVVLVRNGLQMQDAVDDYFTDAAGLDWFAYKGFWLVTLQKGQQRYVLVATHAQAYEDPLYVEVRRKQLRQMRGRVDEAVADGERVVFAGDMNTFEFPYEGAKDFEPEFPEVMLQWEPPKGEAARLTSGALVPKGFWLEMDEDLTKTVNRTGNHYIFYNASEMRLGSQTLDEVLAPGPGDRFEGPSAMRHQVVPMKADHCFESGLVKGTMVDDLSDHYGVFAQLCYEPHGSAPGAEPGGGPCERPWPQPVRGHRGRRKVFPDGRPDCPADQAQEKPHFTSLPSSNLSAEAADEAVDAT